MGKYVVVHVAIYRQNMSQLNNYYTRVTVFKEVHRDGVPTLDRSADIEGEKGKSGSFRNAAYFPLSPLKYLHSDQVLVLRGLI